MGERRTGSTLALAYAQAHPERVRSLTLRGIFTVRTACAFSSEYQSLIIFR